MASRTASSSRRNTRASLALIAGLCGLLAVPAAILIAQRTQSVGLLDVVWAIPFAFAFSLGALLFARGAQGRIRATLDRAGGHTRVRWARRLAVAGICVALAATIAYGFYELLVRIGG